jgi:hypothetical protein
MPSGPEAIASLTLHGVDLFRSLCIEVRTGTVGFGHKGVEHLAAELHDRAISSYLGVGIPGFQVGSRNSSMLPLGSKKYSSRPGKKPCSR